MLIKIIITACKFPSGDDGDSVLLRKEAHLAATRCRVTGDGMAFVKTFAVPCLPSAGGERGRRDTRKTRHYFTNVITWPVVPLFVRGHGARSTCCTGEMRTGEGGEVIIIQLHDIDRGKKTEEKTPLRDRD